MLLNLSHNELNEMIKDTHNVSQNKTHTHTQSKTPIT